MPSPVLRKRYNELVVTAIATKALPPSVTPVLAAKVTVPEGEDFVASDGWDPDDLLEPISEEWQLMLKF